MKCARSLECQAYGARQLPVQAAVPHVHDAALLSVRRAAGVLNYTASVTHVLGAAKMLSPS